MLGSKKQRVNKTPSFEWTSHSGHGKFCTSGQQSEWNIHLVSVQTAAWVSQNFVLSASGDPALSNEGKKAVHNTINGAIKLFRSNGNVLKRCTHLERVIPKICVDYWALINLWLNVNVLLWDGCENAHPPKPLFLLRASETESKVA